MREVHPTGLEGYFSHEGQQTLGNNPDATETESLTLHERFVNFVGNAAVRKSARLAERGPFGKVFKSYKFWAAAVCVSAAIMAPQEKSGDSKLTPPATPVEQAPSPSLRVLSWNTHHQDPSDYSGLLDKLVDRYDPHVIMLQEVTSSQADVLPYYMNEWWVGKVTTDGRQRGGFANVIMSRNKPEDLTTRSFSGSESFATLIKGAEGLTVDVAEAVKSRPTPESLFQHTKKGWEENRAAMAVTVKVPFYDGSESEVRFIVSHIAGRSSNYPDLHDKQFKAWAEFGEENTKEGRLTVMCGDFNAPITEAVKMLLPYGFITQLDRNNEGEAEYTSLPTASSPWGKTIDMCFHTVNDSFEVGLTKVVDDLPAIEGQKNLSTGKYDHRPILMEIEHNSPGT